MGGNDEWKACPRSHLCKLSERHAKGETPDRCYSRLRSEDNDFQTKHKTVTSSEAGLVPKLPPQSHSEADCIDTLIKQAQSGYYC